MPFRTTNLARADPSCAWFRPAATGAPRTASAVEAAARPELPATLPGDEAASPTPATDGSQTPSSESWPSSSIQSSPSPAWQARSTPPRSSCVS
eukprot:2422879-Lingulodinium_polyedra.AAC.1